MAKVGFGLSDYWLIIRKRRWVAILCFVAIFTSVLAHTNMQKPVYRAVCSIRMIERQSVSDMITKMASYTSFDMLTSLSKVLCGRPVIEKVVYELGMADKNTPPEEVDNIILRIQGLVEAENEMGTNIVNIRADYGDPEMAAKIANTVANVYIKLDAAEKNEQAHNLRVFLEEQLGEAKKRLTDAEDKLKTFKEKGEATGIAMIIENNIQTLEKQKMELKKIYTDKYPDIIAIDGEIGNLKKRLVALPESELEYARLTRDMQVSERSYQLLQGKFEEARIVEAERSEDIKIVNPAVITKAPIKPKKQLALVMGLIIGLVVGIFMSFVVETLDTSIGTIDDLESLLKLPVLAVIPYMEPEEKKRKGFLNFLPKRLHGIMARKKRGQEAIEEMKQQMLIKHGQKSSTTEAYRILRTNIKAEELIKTDKRVLLITSTIPREGKSITAVNLSLALAQDGYRTLLIDCDLRKAIVHKIFGINKEPGFTDILLGGVKPESAIRNLVDIMMGSTGIEDALKTPGLDSFNFLPCGKIVSNPSEVLDSAKINELFSDLKSRYDFIVVDSPPVLPVPDAIILGTKIADKLYLVYRSGFTSKLAILRAKEQLDMMKAVPSGVILNSTTPESQLVSDYYHHYYHYRYYSEPESEKGQVEEKNT